MLSLQESGKVVFALDALFGLPRGKKQPAEVIDQHCMDLSFSVIKIPLMSLLLKKVLTLKE